MGIPYDIEKISLELILFSLKETIQHQVLVFCVPDTVIGKALQHVADAFAGSFHNIYSVHSFESLAPEEFVRKSIRISLKLSTITSLLHTLIACAFLTEYIYHLAMDRNCFKLTFTAWKCLTVIVNRKLRCAFEDATRWRLFISSVRRLNQHIDASPGAIIDAVCPSPAAKQRMLELMNECHVIDEGSDLTPEEQAIFTTDDIIEEERENIENRPDCDFCHQACAVFVRFCLKQHRTAYATNYRILFQEQNVLHQLQFNSPSTSR